MTESAQWADSVKMQLKKIKQADAGNAILNTYGKTDLANSSVFNKQMGVTWLLLLDMPVMKPKQSADLYWFTAHSLNS